MIIITPEMEKSMRNTQYPYGWESIQPPVTETERTCYKLQDIAHDLWILADEQLPNHAAAVCIQDLALIIEHIAGLVYDQINLRYQRKEQ
jgi:hypothetical protein